MNTEVKDTVENILGDAENFMKLRRGKPASYGDYEHYKYRLRKIPLTSAQYDRAIRQVTDILKV